MATRSRSRYWMALVVALWPSAATAGPDDNKILILAPPLARADAIWMAQTQGYFKDEKLAVSVRWVSTGADALRIFQEGRDGTRGFGDFVVVSEMLAVNFWQSVDGDFAPIAALARDADSYVGIAKVGIRHPQDLRAKPVATRLGSTSAWALGEYLRSHGMSELDVALENESPEAILSWEPDTSPVAAFFVREPLGTQALTRYGDRVHRLTTAAGYAHSYLLLGTWRRTLKEHPDVAERLLRALDRGQRYAANHKDEVIQFARGMFNVEDTAAVEADYSSEERVVGLDTVTLTDFERLGRWMAEAGLLRAPFDPRGFFDPGPLRATLPDRISEDWQ